MKSFYIIFFLTLFAIGCKSQPHSAMTTLPPETAKLAATMEDQGGEHVHMPKIPTGYSADRYYNVTGAELTPASLKGKVVLVDIWDYTCVNCIRTLPYIKAWAEKYKDKGLEIIGVSDDDGKPEAWRKAVEKDGIGVWKHVLRGLKQTPGGGFDRSMDISDPYGISSLPTKILIDPNGVIVGRYGGGGDGDEAMDKKMAAIFGE